MHASTGHGGLSTRQQSPILHRSQLLIGSKHSCAVHCVQRHSSATSSRYQSSSVMSPSPEAAVMLEELLLPGHGGPAQMQRLLNFIGWDGPKAKDPDAIRIGVLGASQVCAAASVSWKQPKVDPTHCAVADSPRCALLVQWPDRTSSHPILLPGKLYVVNNVLSKWCKCVYTNL